MSDEQILPSMTPAMAPADGDQSNSESTPDNGGDTLNSKLNMELQTLPNEKILLTRRCSPFAFLPLYFVGVFIFVIHWFFDSANAPDDAAWYETLFYFLIEVSTWQNGFGFAFVMLFFTWINRVVNHPASGRWVTSYLLMVSFTPLIINLDSFLKLVGATEEEFFPFDYNLTIAGIFWTTLFMLITFWYQRSFLYAVTTERVIHHQKFIWERDGHRILHEDIVAVAKRRSPLGALFGYCTIYCNIGDGSHLGSETVGGAVAIPASKSSDSESRGGGIIGLIRSLLFIFTYQRTIKVERYTPDVALYGVSKWQEAFELINKLHHENSTATKQDQQLEVLLEMKEMLSKNPQATSEDEIDDLLSDI